MSAHVEVLETLREHRVRLTPQRIAIVEIIAAKQGHVTADEVYAGIHTRFPYVDISTVYRTLEFLTDLGVLNVIDMGGGRAEYELVGREPHHHLVCRVCKQTTSVDASLFHPLREALYDRFGFDADVRHFAVFGVCRRCREAGEAPKGPGDPAPTVRGGREM